MVDKFDEDHHVRSIQEAVEAKNMPLIAGNIAHELWRIANAQEEMLALSKLDLEAQVEETVKSRAETLAEEIAADKSKRSYIGKNRE